MAVKYASVILMLVAIGLGGCKDRNAERDDQADSKDDSPSNVLAEEVKRALEGATRDNPPPRPGGGPGFFDGGSSGQRQYEPDEPEVDPVPDPVAAPPTPDPEPAKRPAPKLVAPGAKAQRAIRLAKLYITNASSASDPAKRKLLNEKAAAILKEVIEEHPQTPSATEAKKLLAEIESAQ